MLPDSYLCNPRNNLKGKLIYEPLREDGTNIFPDQAEVDYRDTDVTSTNIINLFKGRYPPHVVLLLDPP